jgi:hypothetical protein
MMRKIIQVIVSDKRMLVCISCFSFIISASVVIGSKINLDATSPMSFGKRDFALLVALTVVMLVVLSFLNQVLRKIELFRPENVQITYSRRYFPIFSAIIFLCYLPYFILGFPGLITGDGYDEIMQAFGHSNLGNHHPILYTGFIYLFTKIGLLFTASMNSAISVTFFMQMTLVSVTFGYLLYWLYKKNVRPLVLVIVSCFFTLNPMLGMFSIYLTKDTLFSCALLILTLLFADLIISKGDCLKSFQWCGLFITFALLTMFLRNNGLHIVIIVVLVGVIAIKKSRRLLIFLGGGSVIVVIFCTNVIYPALNIGASEFQESVGIPIQQIGRTFATDGNVSENDIKLLEPVLPAQNWKELYDPITVDSFKFPANGANTSTINGSYLDKHRFNFFKAWLSIGVKNPKQYIVAWLTGTSGFWKIGTEQRDLLWSIVDDINTNFSAYDFTKVPNHSSPFLNQMYNKIGKYANAQGSVPTDIIHNMGFAIWPFLLLITLAIGRRKYWIIAATIPAVAAWLTMMIATPHALIFRYTLPYYIQLPLAFIGIVLVFRDNQQHFEVATRPSEGRKVNAT